MCPIRCNLGRLFYYRELPQKFGPSGPVLSKVPNKFGSPPCGTGVIA